MARTNNRQTPRGAEPQEARLPLQGPFHSRPQGLDKDWRFLNCYFEEEAQESFTISRPGIEVHQTFDGTGRGMFVFEDALLWVVDDTIKNDTEDDEERDDRPIPEFTLNTSEGPVYFASWFSSKFIAFDQEYLYVFSFGPEELVTDPQTFTQIGDEDEDQAARVSVSLDDSDIDQATHLSLEIRNKSGEQYVSTEIEIEDDENVDDLVDTLQEDQDVTDRLEVSSAAGSLVRFENEEVIDGEELVLYTFILRDENNNVWNQNQYPADETADLASLPPNLADGVAILAGHAYVMDRNGFIYNSYYDDFGTWDDLDFIAADNVTDRGIRLARFRQYIVALCTESMQIFAHAGKEPPGSPMQEIEQGFNRIGCLSPYSVVELSDSIMWVGIEHNGSYGIYRLDGFQPQKISNDTIERLLEREAEGGFLTEIDAYTISAEGHEFYCVNLYGEGTTLVFDIEYGYWVEWQAKGTTFPFKHTVRYNAETLGMGFSADDAIYRFSIMQTSQSDEFADGSLENVYIEVQTDFFDGDTIREKFLTRLEIYADIHFLDYFGTLPGTIEWTDDDYQNWKSREIDFAKRPVIYRLGRFKKRAFRISSDAPVKHRWRTLDMRYHEGGYSGGST